jgi:rhodanese-related sulfurtransferase
MKIRMTIGSALLLAGTALSGSVMAVGITPSLQKVDVMHNGKAVTIQRDQDSHATIPKAFAHTSRPCPPFCVQPMTVVPGVETVGELEVLAYLKRLSGGDKSIMVVDSRTPDWAARGTIPGAVNIPWNKINVDVAGAFDLEAEADSLGEVLENHFGATHTASGWDFSKAKTLVMFCNGNWCPQSSINIKTLTKLGYPVSKIKWYRGGMQSWVSLGLTTVK